MNKDHSQAHRHRRETGPPSPSQKNRTYINYLCNELERLEGLRELQKNNTTKKELGHIDHAILDYRSQYSTLTGNLYIPAKKEEPDMKRNYETRPPYNSYRSNK